MTRREMLCVPLAACLKADTGDDLLAVLKSACPALGNHNEADFLSAFDPAMKGYSELRSTLHALLSEADVEATVAITPAELTWTLTIAAHDLTAGTTTRQAKTKYTTNQKDGKLRIASLEPLTLFAPPHGREAWDVVSGIAQDLQLASRFAEGRQENHLTPLLAHFDHAMPGYDQLAIDLQAMTSIWIIEPTLELASNEGDDTRRALEIDWILVFMDPENKGSSQRKEATVNCKVEKRGKQWLVTSISPLEFFATPQR